MPGVRREHAAATMQPYDRAEFVVEAAAVVLGAGVRRPQMAGRALEPARHWALLVPGLAEVAFEVVVEVPTSCCSGSSRVQLRLVPEQQHAVALG